jgi:hypothetical protein
LGTPMTIAQLNMKDKKQALAAQEKFAHAPR